MKVLLAIINYCLRMLIICIGKYIETIISMAGWFMVFNDTFNTISVISWLSDLLVADT